MATINLLITCFIFLISSCFGDQNIHGHSDIVEFQNLHEKIHPVLRDDVSAKTKRAKTLLDAFNLFRETNHSEIQNALANIQATNSTQCVEDIMVIYELLKLGGGAAIYGFLMLDAAAKPPPGIFEGQFNWLGNYDQCVNLTYDNIPNIPPFTGRYCNTNVYVPFDVTSGIPSSVSYGLCVPSSCDIGTVNFLINSVKKSLPSILKNITVYGGGCKALPTEKTPFSAGAITMIVLFSIIGFLVVLASLYDFTCGGSTQEVELKPATPDLSADSIEASTTAHTDYSPLVNDVTSNSQSAIITLLKNLLLAFSLPRNVSKLLTIPPSGENNLACIHGIRFLSMTWVILGHTFAFILQSVSNYTFGQVLINRWSFEAILNASVSVDTFFLLSGTLVAYLLLKELDKHNMGWKGWVMFYVHRYWRLTPSYMLLVGAWTTLYRYTGTGPLWPDDNMMAGGCNETWWTNLLYVNNLVKTDKMCMGWSWYLANDMQFYIISPLFVVPLFLLWPVGVALSSVMILVCFIVNGVLSVKYDLGLGFVGQVLDKPKDGNWFKDIYISPWCRIGPYMIGLLLGYILWKTKLNCRIHKAFVVLGWTLATGCALAMTYGPYNLIKGHSTSKEVAAFYNSTTRTVWGACVAWVIFACINGYGGIVNRILSWKALVPLSRLTYMAYLVHPMVIYNYYLSRNDFIHLDDIRIIYIFLGHLVLSYMLACVVSLTLESPAMGIERALRKKK